MKKTVWTYGLIAGGILAAMMAITVPFMDSIGGYGELIGYTTMVLAFLMTFFGISSYRDKVLGGAIGFGRAFVVGILIALIASACYVATWEVIYYTIAPDFVEKYAAQVIEQARSAGASAEQIQARQAEMSEFIVLYKNPLFNIGMTFLEVFPVGLVMVLVSAGILRRRQPPAGAELARA